MKTIAELDSWLRANQAHALADTIRDAKTANGFYRFAPEDALAGPYSGDDNEDWKALQYLADKGTASGRDLGIGALALLFHELDRRDRAKATP